jgi:hypothetical protein
MQGIERHRVYLTNVQNFRRGLAEFSKTTLSTWAGHVNEALCSYLSDSGIEDIVLDWDTIHDGYE